MLVKDLKSESIGRKIILLLNHKGREYNVLPSEFTGIIKKLIMDSHGNTKYLIVETSYDAMLSQMRLKITDEQEEMSDAIPLFNKGCLSFGCGTRVLRLKKR